MPRMFNRPQPVVIAGAVASIVTAITVIFGIQLTEDQSDAVDALVTAVPVIVTMIAAYLASRQVTPTSKPQANDGTPLVKVDGT